MFLGHVLFIQVQVTDGENFQSFSLYLHNSKSKIDEKERLIYLTKYLFWVPTIVLVMKS